MTKVEINPGICGFVARVEAESEDEQMVNLKIVSGCQGIMKIMEEAGGEIDSFEACLCKPGDGVIFDLARKTCPGHASCPVIAGIIKCMEVECKLALPKDAEIKFIS